MTPIDTDHAHTPCVPQLKCTWTKFVRRLCSLLGKSVLIVALAAGLLTQFFPCCAFAIRNFSKVSATPEMPDVINSISARTGWPDIRILSLGETAN